MKFDKKPGEKMKELGKIMKARGKTDFEQYPRYASE